MKINSLILPIRSIRKGIFEWIVQKGTPLYAVFRKKKNCWTKKTLADLHEYSSGSLGNTLALYFQNHQFDLIKGFEDHDVFHVLFQYEPDMLGEVQLQYCLLGMGKRTLPTLFTTAMAFVAYPEWWPQMQVAYRMGKTARNCRKWKFEHLLNESTEELRAFIFKQSNFSNPLIF